MNGFVLRIRRRTRRLFYEIGWKRQVVPPSMNKSKTHYLSIQKIVFPCLVFELNSFFLLILGAHSIPVEEP